MNRGKIHIIVVRKTIPDKKIVPNYMTTFYIGVIVGAFLSMVLSMLIFLVA